MCKLFINIFNLYTCLSCLYFSYHTIERVQTIIEITLSSKFKIQDIIFKQCKDSSHIHQSQDIYIYIIPKKMPNPYNLREAKRTCELCTSDLNLERLASWIISICTGTPFNLTQEALIPYQNQHSAKHSLKQASAPFAFPPWRRRTAPHSPSYRSRPR